MNETKVIQDIVRETVVNRCFNAWKDYMDIIEHAYIQIEPTEEISRSIISGAYYVVTNWQVDPVSLHEEWMRYRESEGWQYGEVKDPELKTHPCMLPFYDLPVEERIKDLVFINAVRLSVCDLLLRGMTMLDIEEALA